MGTGNVHQTVTQLVADFDRLGIDYALIEAMALNAHGYRRETVDVDVLVRPEGLDIFRDQLVGRGYRPAFEGSKKGFRNTVTNTPVEFVTTGEYPGDGKPKPVAFPDPATVTADIDGIRVVNLPTLIQLKLASGMTNPGRRRDLADVQDLIRILGLNASFVLQLDPYVREVFLLLHTEVSDDLSDSNG